MESIFRPPPTHEEIALAAYLIWEEQGKPSDREREIWLQAEKQLLASNPPCGEPKLDPKRRSKKSGRKPACAPVESRFGARSNNLTSRGSRAMVSPWLEG